MPYTPPAQRSPVASKSSTPAMSRTHSYHKQTQDQKTHIMTPSSPPRPGLPRSTSSSAYMSRHRRGPSFSDAQTPPAVEENTLRNKGDGPSPYSAAGQMQPDVNGTIHQSPPGSDTLIPTGAMLSPPESPRNSSDDEENHRGRARDVENLAELQAAIHKIELRKESSPRRDEPDRTELRSTLGLQIPQTRSELSKSFSADDIARQASRLPLSKEARKISHSRSTTDSHIVMDGPPQLGSPSQTSQDSDEDDLRLKPPMVRKKSGELVRPALRPASAKRRPSSMPGTPTYSKAVHFDSHLEHVRHFLQVEKPLAISAGSSPNENYESEIEFPFGNEEVPRSRAQSYEWEIKLSNFPANVEERRSQPVHVERVYLSADKKNLVGQVAVQNLAFNKSVVARFTFDYWKTTSEVSAEYNNDIRRKQTHDGCDRFNFTIRLTDIGNLENKTLFFCVRYNVNGQEFWDNNGSINYQIDFSKKVKLPDARAASLSQGSSPLGALPRSRPSPPMSKGSPRKKSAFLDDFSNGFENFTYGHSAEAVIDDPHLKLRSPRSRPQVTPDAPPRRPKTSPAQVFGNRYDFGASLNAAIQTASSILGDQSGLSESKRRPPPPSIVTSTETDGDLESNATRGPKPDAILSQKPSHQSQSYQELVDKYCFFGSAKTSPQLSKPTLGSADGVTEATSASNASSGSVQVEKSNSQQSTPASSLHRELMNITLSPQGPRSHSPVSKTNSGYGDIPSSRASFGYPYHSSKQNNFFDSHVEYAIQG